MKDTFGLIYASDDDMRLKELTTMRTVASVPFGGRYRIIDFMLSSLVNSGINNVAILAQRNYSSLLDHIGTGSAWDLDRKNEGLRFLLPFSTTDSYYHRGTIDAFRAARDFFQHTSDRYCLYISANCVYNTDFNGMMAQHQATGADITIMYTQEERQADVLTPLPDVLHFDMDENKRIIDMEVGSLLPQSHSVSLGCMLIEKELLDYMVDDAFSRGFSNFTKDVLMQKYHTYRVYGYEHKGYTARMCSVEAYYRANMDLLKPHVRQDLFDLENRVYTKIKDEVPTLYKATGSAKNIMAADGCIIEGDVENSILGRSVTIQNGATVKNSIIMQGSEIQEGAQLENCVLDKNVIVRRGRRMIGAANYPVVVRKNSVV